MASAIRACLRASLSSRIFLHAFGVPVILQEEFAAKQREWGCFQKVLHLHIVFAALWGNRPLTRHFVPTSSPEGRGEVAVLFFPLSPW
jgi:hypothetical protein